MTSDRGAWPSLRSVPAGWQDVLNPKLTRRGLLGGMVATPVALFADRAFGQTKTIVWYDLELVIADDMSAVSVLEVKVTRSEDQQPVEKNSKIFKTVVNESRCILSKWSVPATAFGEYAFFDMAQPLASPINHETIGFERVLHVRGVVYGLRFTRDDREASKMVAGPDGKRRKPGFVSFRFVRPPGDESRWTIAYETDLWLRASGNTDAVESSRPVKFETFVDETAAAPDVAQSDGALNPLDQRKRPSEVITALRVGGTLDLTFGALVATAGPNKGVFDVSFDRNLVWHVEALGGAALLVHDGRVRTTKFEFAWRRFKEKAAPDARPKIGDASGTGPQTLFFSGEAAGHALSVLGPGGAYKFGSPNGHSMVVKPFPGAALALDVVVGHAPFWPDMLQAICALRIETADLSIRMGEAKIAAGVAARKLTIAQTTTSGARAVTPVRRGVIWGEALGSAAPFVVPKEAANAPFVDGGTAEVDPKEGSKTEPETDGLGRIETPIGPLVVARPIRRLAMPPEETKTQPKTLAVETGVTKAEGKAEEEKVCKPLTVEIAEEDPRDKDALIRFFRIANGDRSGDPEASVYALADHVAGTSFAAIRRAQIDLTLRGASTALPDTSFSELAFQSTELRLAYEDGVQITELSAGEYPLPLSSSYVWIGPADPPILPLASIDLSRATLTCARDYDLMKLRLRFHDLVLHYGPEPTVRPKHEEARLRVREDGELQDSRPLLVAEFDPQHVMEEAIFLPEAPELPDVELDPPDTREAIVQDLIGLKTVDERVKYREKIKSAKIAKENKSGLQKGPFEIVAEAFKEEVAKLDYALNLAPRPKDQQVYIGPFALDPDAMGIARRLMKKLGDAAIKMNLSDTLDRVARLAAEGSPLRGKQLVDLPDAKAPPPVPAPEPSAVFAIALRNEAVLESLEPFYGVFRTFWRDAFANPGGKLVKAKSDLKAKYPWMLAEYLSENNRPAGYPPTGGDPLYIAIVEAFVNWALGRTLPDDLMGARLSGPSRLAFRINAETSVSVDAYEAGALPQTGDGISATGAGNTLFRPISFTFEGLTEWSRFEPAVVKRAQKLFQTLPSGVLPRPGNRPENPSDQAMMRFQGFTEGLVTGEARMAEVRASLKSERIANLETGDNKPWPGEPLDFETAIELPARLILSTAQDAVWRTNRRMPKELFLDPLEKSCPVLASEDTGPELESGSEPIMGEIVNDKPFDLWSVRLETRSENPGVRAVASPDLRTTALAVRRKVDATEQPALGDVRPQRLPGEGPPPRGPYAAWFIGLDQLESETLEDTLSTGGMATRLGRWLKTRVAFRKDLPKENYTFFRTSLDAFDRHQLVLLTSTYGLPVIGKRLPGETDKAEPGGLIANSGQIEPGDRFSLLDARDDQALHRPVPFEVKALSLTALGGSLLHETSFKPSAGADDIYGNKIFEGFSIDTLQQDIVLGRDIRTEVVYKGYLLPLGHKASFVKLTERIFLKVPGHGIKAILRQRMFVRMADPEKLYGAMGQANAGRQWCAKKVRLTTDKTPDILDPTFPLSGKLDDQNTRDLNGRIWLGGGPGLAFWPRTDVTQRGVFRFPVTIDGAPTELPMIFIDNIAATSSESVLAACRHYNALPIEKTLDPPQAYSRTLRLAGRKLDYAPNSQSGEGQFETDRLIIRAQGRLKEVDPVKWIGELEAEDNFVTTGVLEGASQPPFYPTTELATIRLGRVERMSGGQTRPVDVQYDGHYVLYGFPGEEPPRGLQKPEGKYANPQEIFLVLRDLGKLDMGDSGDRSGGIARPNSHIVAISRSKGPMGGDEGTWWSAGPKEIIPTETALYNRGAPHPTRLEKAMGLGGLVSLAPYFNDLVDRPKPEANPAVKEEDDDKDPYDPAPEPIDEIAKKTAAVLAQVKSFFSMDAKLLGTVRLKHIMKLLGLSLDSVPLLKEVQEFGTAALREADQLSNDVRSRVLAPLSDIVGRLRREWQLFDKKVSDASSELQKGIEGLVPTTPLSLGKVYPEVETGLTQVEAALSAALATEDAASLLTRLSAIHAAAKLLLRGLALIAANPVERLDDAITGNLKEKIEALTKIVETLANLATGFEVFIKEVLDDAPGVAAELVTDRIFAWFGGGGASGAPAPPKLAELMPLASLPPTLPELAKTMIVDVDAKARTFLDEVDRITADLSTKIDAASKTALRAMLVATLTDVFSGGEPQPAIESGVDAYRTTIKAKFDTAIGDANAALKVAANGAELAVATAASALTDALESYREKLASDLFDAAFDLISQYPDELQSVATGLQKIEAATRSGKTLATALKEGNPTVILKQSAGFARDVLGVNIAAVETELDALKQAIEDGFVIRARALLRDANSPFRFVPSAAEEKESVLAREMAAVRRLRVLNYKPEKPHPLPIYSSSNDTSFVVASNGLLKAVGEALHGLGFLVDPARNQIEPSEKGKSVDERTISLLTTLDKIIDDPNNREKIDAAAKIAKTPDAKRLLAFMADVRMLVEGTTGDRKNCLIADLEGLYGDVVDIAVATRAFEGLLDKALLTPMEIEEALGELMRRLRQLGKALAARLEAMVKHLADFAQTNKGMVATGALIGGAATVLDGYLQDGKLDELAADAKAAIRAAKTTFDTVEKDLVEDLITVVNFALSLIGDTAVGGDKAIQTLQAAVLKIRNVAAGFGVDIGPETRALDAALAGLKTHLEEYSGLALPVPFSAPAGKTILEALLDADLGKGGLTPRKLFNSASGAASFDKVEAALRKFESAFPREVRRLRARLAGAPNELRQAAEKALTTTGVFPLLSSAYVKIVEGRDGLLNEVIKFEPFRAIAEKTLNVEREPALDVEGAPIDEKADRLDQEAAVAADLAAIKGGQPLDASQRRRLVALLQGWSNNKAAPLAIKDQAEDFAKDLMRGDVLAAIDFGGFRDQIEDAIASLIPTKVNLTYDFASFVKEDAGPQAIFRPLIGSDFGIALRATIDLLKGRSEFGATASIGPFEIFLIGGIVDALRLKFRGAAFTVATNTSARFDVLYEDFVIGKDLEFAQKLQSFLSPKGGGAFIQPMTRGAGIEVGYGLDLGTIGVGATSFFNVSLNVSAELPFGDQESLFKVSLGRRLSPFTMGVFPFVGSGYFAIYAAANGIRGFEASFEYGGGAAIGYGPFQASVRIQAGVFVRIIKDGNGKKTTEIYGTFFAGGSASIWIFHFATSLYVRLGTAEGGAMYGEAIYSFSFSLGIADYDYSITAFKKEKSLGNQPNAASLDRGGPTRFAALPAGVDPMTTASIPDGNFIVVHAANQTDGWRTYATYFNNSLTAEFFR
ncbi:hypothetical protein NKH61_27715 [Mesorhizobium sp. M1005]|uniref:hypothetical protein n=1 Tax=unclassified Mesorhizobium TaxID=325217 RepID=UPI003339C536